MLQLKTKKSRQYNAYVKAINGILQLPDRLCFILSILLELQINWDEGLPIDIQSTSSRKYIMSRMSINKNNLSKYLRMLRDKGITKITEDGWRIKDNFLPEVTETGIEVKINIYHDNENEGQDL
jgi:predicted transcriptional regulator